ncbi:cyclase family protein [Nonomuraea sp. NBC_01738]|uniref:cyclase family protein n=1 Tax=Nonomuraea sp. NBC_01738 TaxID=2976003 RepID=UPI002E16750E|nr:cyclase family protein [Nonomuraea sp. NBC_01738]
MATEPIAALLGALTAGTCEIIDLTAPLSSRTPIIGLPAPYPNTPGFSLTEISRYDDERGHWYWNEIHTGEHVGTHLDAPNHWITGRDGLDVSRIPLRHLLAPAVVLDFAAEAADDPGFLLEIEHVEAWIAAHGPLPEGGWLLYRTGWDERAHDQDAFLNEGRTPGVSVECARYLAASPIAGLGVETVGTDAGAAHSFDLPFPCHDLLLGAGKYGLTQLANLAALPATGALLLVAPLPIVGGSGSPARVLALMNH